MLEAQTREQTDRPRVGYALPVVAGMVGLEVQLEPVWIVA